MGGGVVTRLHDIREIVGMLAARAPALAQELLPGGVRRGGEWVAGSLAGERGRSLAVHLHGQKAGVWADFASGQRGDALDLIAQARCGGDKSDALRWARNWLGLGDGRTLPSRAPVVAPAGPDRSAEDRAKRMRAAKAMWLQARPLEDTPAASYLAGRGVSLQQLGRVPQSLRFAPDAWCDERRIKAPALVAAVTCNGLHVATHRIFIAPRGAGWGKAPIRDPKKAFGPIKGGLIPIWRGASGKPLKECQADDTIAICEGIEDALTLALHMPEWRILACINLGNMADVILPENAADVVLVFDRDGENPRARDGRQRAVENLLSQGRSVREIRPPEGHKDFNAWHMAQLREHVA